MSKIATSLYSFEIKGSLKSQQKRQNALGGRETKPKPPNLALNMITMTLTLSYTQPFKHS